MKTGSLAAESDTLLEVPPPLRIALFHPALVAGGIQRVFLNLAQGFRERGCAVDLVQAARGDDFRSLVPPGVRVVDLGASRALTSFPRLVSYLRRERPDAMISGAIQTNVVAAWARRVAGIHTRLILTEHSALTAVKRLATTSRGRFADQAVRRFYPWADAIVAISQEIAGELTRVAGLPAAAIRIVSNPLLTPQVLAQAREPVEHPWFRPGEPPVILSAGRLDVFKDYPTLIRAFHRVRSQRRARLMLLGEGTERERLESLVRSLSLQEDVALPGNVLNPHSYMAAAAVFVLSSTSEGVPAVLVEALAGGCPVVSTDSGSGVRDILRDGALGRIVPVSSPELLADAIITTLERPRPALADDALRRFDYLTVADEYLKLVESLLSAANGRSAGQQPSTSR